MRLDQLPSRPFAIGYVRAYAKALGLDPDAAAARFGTRHPSPTTRCCAAPVGVRPRTRPAASGWSSSLGVLVVAAIVVWNIAQHVHGAAPAPQRQPRPPPPIAAAQRQRRRRGPVSLGAPLPAPPEATAPAPYVTPGLGPARAAPPTPRRPPTPTPSRSARPSSAKGAIYGAAGRLAR